MKTPEQLMKEGFESFFKARECFQNAAIEYDKIAGHETLNGENVNAAIHFMARAYDEVSAIWENDIQGMEPESLLDQNNDVDTVGKCANCGVEFHIHK